MVDPVERTFDAVYSWSQYIQRNAQSTYTHLKNHAEDTYDVISQTISSQLGSNDLPPIELNGSSSSGLFSWKTLNQVVQSAKENKILTTSALFATIIGLRYAHSQTLLPFQSFKYGKCHKRRAERLPNGARKEVLLIVGNITDPLTRYIAQDLEIRGFIVYITSQNTSSELRIFGMDIYSDLKPLIVSVNDWEFSRGQLCKFNEILQMDHFPFAGSSPNKLKLAGVLISPEILNGSPRGKFHSMSSIELEKCLGTNINHILGLFHSGLLEICENYEANLVVLQSIKLELPFNIPENLINSQLENFTELIRIEYPNLNVKTLKIASGLLEKLKKGQALRSLFYKVFDLIYGKSSKWLYVLPTADVQFIGTGSRVLYLCKSLAPNWLVRSYYNGYFGNGQN